MKPKIFIDGEHGTTGLQIRALLAERGDLEIISIPTERRKETAARAEFLNAADVAILCLPDAAAKESVSLIANDTTKVIDASTAHRVAEGWDIWFCRTGQGTGQDHRHRQARRQSRLLAARADRDAAAAGRGGPLAGRISRSRSTAFRAIRAAAGR